jgi:2-keto-3-deoxy-L-rhamnonate aldolase RhmA
MLSERLYKGERAIGTMVRVCRNPIITNIAKNAGLDFVMLDMEQGSYSYETLADIFMAARSLGLATFVRVPELARGYVSRALDLGVNGVMSPMIETVEQAKMLVEWSKYTPVGNRGMSPCGGHTGYKKETDICGMMARLNEETLAIAQIETAMGVDAADEIASVEGIDVLLVGPNDLSVSLGCPGDLNCEKEQEAILKVAEACKKNGKIFGIHGGGNLLEKWIQHDLRFIMSSTDFEMIDKGMKGLYESCKKFI